MSGFKELKIPMLDSWEQQLGEIAILSQSGPAPNPDHVQLEQQIAQLTAQIKAVTTPQPMVGAIPMVGGQAPVAPVAPPRSRRQNLSSNFAQLTRASFRAFRR